MLWFTKDKRARIIHRYKERRGFTNLISRDLPLQKSISCLIRLTEAGFAQAEEDEHIFRQIFNEPMPEHLRVAVHLETDLWVAIRTTLDAAKSANLTVQEYNRLQPQLRQNLTTLDKLLDLEAEIMQSPLTKTFLAQLQVLREARA